MNLKPEKKKEREKRNLRSRKDMIELYRKHELIGVLVIFCIPIGLIFLFLGIFVQVWFQDPFGVFCIIFGTVSTIIGIILLIINKTKYNISHLFPIEIPIDKLKEIEKIKEADPMILPPKRKYYCRNCRNEISEKFYYSDGICRQCFARRIIPILSMWSLLMSIIAIYLIFFIVTNIKLILNDILAYWFYFIFLGFIGFFGIPFFLTMLIKEFRELNRLKKQEKKEEKIVFLNP